MTLLHSDGSEADLPAWLNMQVSVSSSLPIAPLEGSVENGEEMKIRYWCRLFAKTAREICDEYEVDIETFEVTMKNVLPRLERHIKHMRYYLSQSAHRSGNTPITLDAILAKIHIHIEPIVTEQFRTAVSVRILFEPVTPEAKGYIEACMFPIYKAKVVK